MISLLVSDFRKISVSVPSIPVAVLGSAYTQSGFIGTIKVCLCRPAIVKASAVPRCRRPQ
jgi:hypothetical protein